MTGIGVSCTYVRKSYKLSPYKIVSLILNYSIVFYDLLVIFSAIYISHIPYVITDGDLESTNVL
jgi:hypothetical protein